MIRVLLAPGSAAAANGITADVDVLLDIGAAEFGGDNFTVNVVLDEGVATGAASIDGSDTIVFVILAAGEATGSVDIASIEKTISTTLSPGGIIIPGADYTVTVQFDSGISTVSVDLNGEDFTVTTTLAPGTAEAGAPVAPDGFIVFTVDFNTTATPVGVKLGSESLNVINNSVTLQLQLAPIDFL
jgi:hypothetical protein